MDIMAKHWNLDDGPAPPADGHGNEQGDEGQGNDEVGETEKETPCTTSEVPAVPNEHVGESQSHDQPDIQPQYDLDSLRLQREAVL